MRPDERLWWRPASLRSNSFIRIDPIATTAAQLERPWCLAQSLGPGDGHGQLGVCRTRAEEDRELYRGIFYEPPYSIWQAAVSSIVIAIGELLYLWLWGE